MVGEGELSTCDIKARLNLAFNILVRSLLMVRAHG
jgi:hypothetical protein